MRHWLRVLGILACALLLVGTACQQPAKERTVLSLPEAPPPAPARPLTLCERSAKAPVDVPDTKVNASFRSFAKTWLDKMRKASVSTTVRRHIPEQIETELRPTGSKTAPYVGILRYCDQSLRCTGAAASTCQHTASTVVTEIFRFQGGKWVY